MKELYYLFDVNKTYVHALNRKIMENTSYTM